MDDHPPNWDDNGERHLVQYGLTSNTSRLNPFLAVARDPYAKPIDALTLARGLVENYSLTSLELYRCNLDVADAAALAQALAVNKYITYVGLARNRFFTKGAVHLSEALKVNQTILTLDLSWNDLRDEFAVSFAEALVMNNSLQRVILDRNKLSTDGLSVLSHGLANNRKIRYLGLAHNNITAAGLAFLGQSIQANDSNVLATIDVSQNGIAAEGIFSLCTMLSSMPRPSLTLTTLNLAFNKVSTSIALVGQAVLNMPALRELNLTNTLLTVGADLSQFARMIAQSKSLVNVAFASNKLGDEGVDVLSEALATLRGIKFVDFSDTGFGSEGLRSICRLVKNAPLQTLHLNDNNLSDDTCGATLASIIGGGLVFLGLARCSLTSRSIDLAFSHLHAQPPALTGLSLRGNGMGDAGFAQLLPFVLNHGKFAFLDLAENHLTGFVRSRFPDVFQMNFDLKFVVMEDLTVIDRDNVARDWSELAGKAPVQPHHPLPHWCDASMDLQTSLPPSAGFSTYSASIGSSIRRQLETNDNLLYGLVPFGGYPVKGCSIWQGSALAAATPNLRGKKEFQGPSSSPKYVAALESNIGGLLISDDQLRREFNRLDVTGNGYLSVEDFKSVYNTFEHFGVKKSDAEIDRVMRMHGGGQGLISFDLFCLLMLKLVQH